MDTALDISVAAFAVNVTPDTFDTFRSVSFARSNFFPRGISKSDRSPLTASRLEILRNLLGFHRASPLSVLMKNLRKRMETNWFDPADWC